MTAADRPDQIRFDQLHIVGESRAGDTTWFRVDPPGIAFDVGRGSSRLIGADPIFLSHGHLDHSLGLPFLLSQRHGQGLPPATIVFPSPIEAPLRCFLESARTLEQVEYDFQLAPFAVGDEIEVGRDLTVEAFATGHRVPSLGYCLFRTVRRLRDEYREHGAKQLAELRERGVETTYAERRPWLCYPGDTDTTVFITEPRIFDAEILLLECTFLDDRKRDLAEGFGHLHLDDIVEYEPRFRNRSIVLHHLSRRHRPRELRRAVDDRLPRLRDRIRVLGEVAGEHGEGAGE